MSITSTNGLLIGTTSLTSKSIQSSLPRKLRTDCRRLGGYSVKRGEIRWYTFALPDKRPPVLILTRDEVIEYLNEIIVVPITRTTRGVETEVILTPDDGMPVISAL